MIALGERTTGLMSNDQEAADRVLDAAEAAGEEFWQLPIPKEIRTCGLVRRYASEWGRFRPLSWLCAEKRRRKWPNPASFVALCGETSTRVTTPGGLAASAPCARIR
jgi:Cytosol aminopeptidase family, catalytic domain